MLLLNGLFPFAAALADASRARPGSVEHLGEVDLLADSTVGSKVVASPPVPKPNPNNKDAPVDGLDGRPKVGPFVEKNKPIAVVEDLTSGGNVVSDDVEGDKSSKGELDGWAVPETDYVMDDRPHDKASKKGPTGLEGGISEKERARKEKQEKGEAPQPKIPQKVLEKENPNTDSDSKHNGKSTEEHADQDAEGKFKPLEVSALVRSLFIAVLARMIALRPLQLLFD